MSGSSHIPSIFNVSRNYNFYIYVPLSYNGPAFMLRGVFIFLSEFYLWVITRHWNLRNSDFGQHIIARYTRN